MEHLNRSFFEKVIQETRTLKLSWLSLFDLSHKYDFDELPGFQFLISGNEYHTIDTTGSFLCMSYHFALLILNETFISGRDSFVTKQINVYLSKDVFTLPQRIEVDPDLLTKLIDEIEKIYSELRTLKSKAKAVQTAYIMKSYLKDSSDD